MNADGSVWAIGYGGPSSTYVDLMCHDDDDDVVDSDWIVSQRIKIPKAYREMFYHFFGSVVVMDATASRIAISAQGANNDGVNVGKVFVYEKTYKKGVLKYRCVLEIDPPGGGVSGMSFGHSMAMTLTGNRLYVGSFSTRNPEGGNQHPARVHEYALVYEENKLVARLEYIFEALDKQSSGYMGAISLNADANILAIGIPTQNEVRVYRRHDVSGEWQYDQTVVHPGGSVDLFGKQVILSQNGERMLVSHERPRFHFLMGDGVPDDAIVELSLFSID
ncbi:MAG: hypothetical protein ACR2HF_15610 [Methylococcaceae bacterium]